MSKTISDPLQLYGILNILKHYNDMIKHMKFRVCHIPLEIETAWQKCFLEMHRNCLRVNGRVYVMKSGSSKHFNLFVHVEMWYYYVL